MTKTAYTKTASFSDRDAAVWDAAYAAAFVDHLERNRTEGARIPFERAVQVTTAEHACRIADLAVYRLRQWRDEEHPRAGVMLGEIPDAWDEG